MQDSDAVLRIGEVSLRTEVSVPTLRAWEQRYGLLQPERTTGGHRLYSERDIERVRSMSRLIGEGWAAAAAAREALREDTSPPLASEATPAVTEALVTRMTRAIDDLDAPTVDGIVDDVLARFDIPRAVDEVFMPVLHHLGDGWANDPRVIAREHFATNALRPRLQRLLRIGSRPGGRSCIAAAPEHEEHDMGLLCAAVVAADAGWRVHYLGARTPTEALERAVAEVRPQVVLVASLFREHAEAFLDEMAPRPGSVAFVLGGAGFHAEDVERLAAATLHTGPMAALPATMAEAVETRATSTADPVDAAGPTLSGS